MRIKGKISPGLANFIRVSEERALERAKQSDATDQDREIARRVLDLRERNARARRWAGLRGN